MGHDLEKFRVEHGNWRNDRLLERDVSTISFSEFGLNRRVVEFEIAEPLLLTDLDAGCALVEFPDQLGTIDPPIGPFES